jgi:hypothetical protein
MIDTSIVRVHQHAACNNKRQSMGSRSGLLTRIRPLAILAQDCEDKLGRGMECSRATRTRMLTQSPGSLA